MRSLLPFDIRRDNLLRRKLACLQQFKQYHHIINLGNSLNLGILQVTALFHPMRSGQSTFYMVDHVRSEQPVSG